MIRRVFASPLRISLLVTTACLGLYWLTAQSVLGRNLETKLLDMRLHLRGVEHPQVPVALVVIDDKSIAALGRWPWSREQFAVLLRHLTAAGARVVAFDILFSESENAVAQEAVQRVRSLFEALDLSSLDASLQAFHRHLVALATTASPDSSLATALAEAGNALLAFAGEVTAGPSPVDVPATPPAGLSAHAYRAIRRSGSEPPRLSLHAQEVLLPIAPLARAAHALGHVTVAFDTDGTPRYDYPVMAYQDAYYPSLALQALRVYLGLALEEVQVHFGAGIQLGSLFLPTDEAMRMLVRYYGPSGTFPTYSFVDVLSGHVPATLLRERIVFIGAAATGLGDTFVTPFSAALPGVERHATVLANVLHSEALQRREATAWIDLGTMLGLGLILGWLGTVLPWSWGTGATLLVGGGYVTMNILVLTRLGVWLNLLFPCLTVVSSYGAITLYEFLTEARQRRMLRRAFQHYLHPSVVEQVSQHPELLALGGEKRELTVLFSDIRGFSTLSEGLTPELLVQLLNEYFHAMTQAVFADEGLLDKYIGDAIMAVYGAPLPMPDHACRACHTALCMLEALRQLRPRWQARGLPAIDIGIGINSGSMVVGNMGSEYHFSYTVMGDEVNLGSRLEGVNKEYGTHILISEATWEQVQTRMVTREVDVIRVKGKAKPTRIYEVLGMMPPSAQQTTLIRLFSTALEAYRAQHWDEALQLFRQVLEAMPEEAPSQHYIQRCETFRRTPPAPDWDGVYSMLTK